MIIRPTEDNVRRYMELEARVVRQAFYFADVAQRVAWSTPSLDMSLECRPLNAQAIQVYDREMSADRQKSVATLGKTHVLFFFYRSDCPYCHAFAPTLEAFQARHGIQVVPISVDGGGLSAGLWRAVGIPAARADRHRRLTWCRRSAALCHPYSVSAELRSGRLQASKFVRPDLSRYIALASPKQGKLSPACRVVANMPENLVASWGHELTEPPG